MKCEVALESTGGMCSALVNTYFSLCFVQVLNG